MGKLLHFPIARLRARRATAVFADFGELALSERAQLRLFAACAGSALLLTGLLQLSV